MAELGVSNFQLFAEISAHLNYFLPKHSSLIHNWVTIKRINLKILAFNFILLSLDHRKAINE